MNNRRKLNVLKWATVLLPPLSIWLYETIRHSFLDGIIEGWPGNLLAALIILVISYVFAHTAFKLIARMQTRLLIQNKRLHELNQRVRELAIIEERSRLSREMHDGLAQLLAFVMMKVDTLQSLIQAKRVSQAQIDCELEQVYKACNEAYNDVREAITGLRPEICEGRSFPIILAELLDRFATDNQLTASFENYLDAKQNEQLFPPATTVQLLRVVQEALSNIRKHAQARNVKVVLRLQEIDPNPCVQIIVQDDGLGFVANTVNQNTKRFGQIIMRERIESLEGTLEIQSVPGCGTTLQINLPLANALQIQQRELALAEA